jgi:tRNA(Ile)-lysidine synthase
VYDISEIKEKTLEKNNTAWFDYDIIEHNIVFRTRQEGDYITIHPDGRTQKLKSYFINEKIPQEERDKILLVADGSHILWIVGYRKNIAYCVGPNTKRVLEIKINEGEK